MTIKTWQWLLHRGSILQRTHFLPQLPIARCHFQNTGQPYSSICLKPKPFPIPSCSNQPQKVIDHFLLPTPLHMANLPQPSLTSWFTFIISTCTLWEDLQINSIYICWWCIYWSLVGSIDLHLLIICSHILSSNIHLAVTFINFSYLLIILNLQSLHSYFPLFIKSI